MVQRPRMATSRMYDAAQLEQAPVTERECTSARQMLTQALSARHWPQTAAHPTHTRVDASGRSSLAVTSYIVIPRRPKHRRTLGAY